MNLKKKENKRSRHRKAISEGNLRAKMAYLEKRAAYSQRAAMTNHELALYYIEQAGNCPDMFLVYMERANYYLTLSRKHENNSNMYFHKSREEYKKLKRNEEK